MTTWNVECIDCDYYATGTDLDATLDDSRHHRATHHQGDAMTQPGIAGMVDDHGRPATIFTPPEVLRRDPARWPTPTEFMAEWGRYTDEQRTALAERILRDAQDVERLNRTIEQAEARVDQLTDQLTLANDTLRLMGVRS